MFKITVHPNGDPTATYYMDSVESAILLFKTWYAEKDERITWFDEGDEVILSSAQAHAFVVPHV